MVKKKRLCQWQSRCWGVVGGCSRSKGQGSQQALTWFLGTEVLSCGGPVTEKTVSRPNIHIVDVGGGLGLVISAYEVGIYLIGDPATPRKRDGGRLSSA